MSEEIRDNVNTVNYKRFFIGDKNPSPRSASRQYKVNPYISFRYEESRNPGEQRVTRWSYGTLLSVDVAPYLDTASWIVHCDSINDLKARVRSPHKYESEADVVAIAKLYSFVREAKGSDFNAGTFFAEADKTLKSIFTTATRVFAFVSALKKGRLGDAYRALGISSHQSPLTRELIRSELRRAPKSHSKRYQNASAGDRLYPRPKTVRDNAANYFLETRYGWMPLLQDVYHATKKIADLVLEKPTVLKVRARQTMSDPQASSGYSAEPHSASSQWSQFSVDNVRIQYVVRYTVPSPIIATASSLGLTNPLSIIWEVTPLSFVVDWFLPVGQFLENLSTFTGLDIQTVERTRVRQIHSGFIEGNTPVSTTYDVFEGPDGQTSYTPRRETAVSGGTARCKAGGMSRVILDAVPFPTLKFSENFSWAKAAVTGALLQQRLPRK